MTQFILWYSLVTFLGWATFPLTFHLFPALLDRGFSLARTLGMLVWGYGFWMMASLGIIQNDGSGLIFGMLILMILSGTILFCKNALKSMKEWIGNNWQLIVTVEMLFFLAFAVMAFIRSGNPEIVGTEKPMELAFINAILHSPTFPPHDPWLSGYGISYYYFGYVMTAMLAKATMTLGSVAFNLMLALVFALSAIGAYGIIYNLLAYLRKKDVTTTRLKNITRLPLLGPLFLLIVSNFEGFLDVLHNLGLFWKYDSSGNAYSSFWNWLGILDLNQVPIRPFGLMPERNWWWWRASRVISDYSLANVRQEVIDEFPFFSYLLGDLHPHVLAMPFGLLAVGVALNLFFGGWKGISNLGLFQLRIRPIGLFFSGLILGGLAFLNTWDILIGFALIAGAYTLMQVLEFGWEWKRFKDFIALGLPLGLLAIGLYLPFYAGFSSQAGGILPNLENPTRGSQLWVMFGPLFVSIFGWLIYLRYHEKQAAKWKLGFGLSTVLAVSLWLFSWLLGLLVNLKLPEFVSSYLANEGFVSLALYFSAATLRRISFIGGLLTLLVLLGTAISFFINREVETVRKEEGGKEGILSDLNNKPTTFILFIIILGGLLVLAPEFVYLRDQFNDRMNTLFKFYYQAWMLWSLAAAFGVAILLQNLRHQWRWIWRSGLVLILLMALVYPILGLLSRTNNFQIAGFIENLKTGRASGDPSALMKAAGVWNLDGATFYERINPDDMAAATWLRNAPAGIILEASKPDASYTEYSRFSTYSGLPTVLGWPMHEGQWRGTYEPQGTRQEDIRIIYETSSWEEAKALISKYGIRYICVGTLEWNTYHLNDGKFQQYLSPVFQQGQVTIYEVP